MKTLNELFREVILANELENKIRLALEFSDPDGVRSGKSGWSFGVSQFDTQNNDAAIECLKECGFSSAEIRGIVNQKVDVRPFAARLAAHAEVIERYDEAQLGRCVNSAMNVVAGNGIRAESPGGILALADYVNQYGSIGPQFVKFMVELGRPVIAADVLNFKLLHTKYGREHKGDCKRRYANLIEIVKEST